MQIRRPLCLPALIFVLLAVCCVYGSKAEKDELPAEGERISLTGIVSDREYRVMFGSKIPVIYVNSLEDKNDRQVMCYMAAEGSGAFLPRMGERVRVSGKVSHFREAGNPGEFDLREYYRILNISYKLNQTEILECSGSCFLLKEKLFQLKCRCGEMLERIYPPAEASVLKAMLLGEKNGLDEEIKELYQLNGLIHILAISGLHVSLLGMALSGLFKKCGMPLWLRAPFAMGFMYCYGLMTGMGVSTRRAVFMFMLHLAAELAGRTYDMLTALSLAAVLLLAEQPLLVCHSGFLLSFGAVLGIGAVLPWWKEMLEDLTGIRLAGRGDRKGQDREKNLTALYKKAGGKLTDLVLNGLCLGSGIAAGTLPVLLSFYYVYPPCSLLLNIYVIPLMGPVLAFGVLSLAAGVVLPAAASALGVPVRLILGLYEISCREVLKWPGGIRIAGKPELWQILAYYVILLALILWRRAAEEREEMAAGKSTKSKKGKKIPCRIPAICQWLLVLGALWLLLIRPIGGLGVTFLDVGQGDCIVIRNDNGNCYMVDGGSSDKSGVGKYQILPFLESEGIGELEAVFITHPDEDHISGIMEMMEQSGYGVRIKSLILPDVSEEIKGAELLGVRKQAAEYEIPVCYIGRGDELRDGKLKFTCIGPEKGLMTDEVNEISTVLYTEYGDFNMLLTGDVTGGPEKELIPELAKKEPLILLKAAHHGSKYSTPRELLEVTDPVYAVISAGRDNRYGHPHEELIRRLKEQGCRIYQTPESGAVMVRIKNGRIQVQCHLIDGAGRW